MANWTTISQLVYTTLSAHTALTTLLSNGADSIYPLLADAEEGDDFVTYYAQYESKPSKDGVYDYTITINSFAKTYNEAIAIADQVTNAIAAASEVFKIGPGKPEINEQTEFYITQIFNIKK
jgi:hypothetical protein